MLITTTFKYIKPYSDNEVYCNINKIVVTQMLILLPHSSGNVSKSSSIKKLDKN